jgi:hypothetical protein
LYGETPADYRGSVPKERGTFIVDADGCVFTYRSFRAHWLCLHARELFEAIQALLGDALSNPSLEKKCKHGPRGPHFPCIIGHQRQYQRVGKRIEAGSGQMELTPSSFQDADLTAFHKSNLVKVEAFMKTPIIMWIK